MGTTNYEPKNTKNGINQEDSQETEQGTSEQVQNSSKDLLDNLINNIDSARPIGDTDDCEYLVYIEDYAYTYLYQYAKLETSKEQAAVIVGQFYEDSREHVVCGIIPIDPALLQPGEEWVGEGAIQAILSAKEEYFPGGDILGWVHTQPGYGTMLTNKEIKTHKTLFNENYTLLLLVDPVNKIETFYAYDNGELKEQTGYYLYYDKNPCMQRYMLDNPFVVGEKEEVEDTVVKQFREIGNRRKHEYETRQKTNFTVVAGCLILLAAGAILTRMSDGGEFSQPSLPAFQAASANEVEDNITQQYSFEPTSGSLSDNSAIAAISDEMEVEDDAVDEVDNVEDDNIKEETATTSAETADDTDDTEKVDEPNETAKEDIKEDEKEEVKEEETAKEDDKKEETAKSDEKEEAEEALSDAVEDEGNYVIYTVEPGDTLRSISVEYFKTELRARDISTWNNIENGDHISVGQKLKILIED
ncbi:MAG: hypothetical protein ATN36_08170 [Epulopiscium sp. Nele67-Bin005]|nr:MAG: hypothetical protein ATN36_08170 [Epulopiscium sp. Nele67-Bin005]